jgi:hypothetical protein
VVQGHRAAKNTRRFAMLDAMSEEINNNIYGKGHVLLVCLLGYGFWNGLFLSIIQEYHEEY